MKKGSWLVFCKEMSDFQKWINDQSGKSLYYKWALYYAEMKIVDSKTNLPLNFKIPQLQHIEERMKATYDLII